MVLGQGARDALAPKPVDVKRMSGKQLASALFIAQLVHEGPRIPHDEYKTTRSHVKPSSAQRRAARIAAGKAVVKDGKLHAV